MDTSGCKAEFLGSELRRILPQKLVDLFVLPTCNFWREFTDASVCPLSLAFMSVGNAFSSRNTSQLLVSKVSRAVLSATTPS